MATNDSAAVVPPAPAPSGNVRELRIALVCYGGVSLAIYMHGVTRELHKLVLASAAYVRDPAMHDFKPNSSEQAYWALLRRIDQEGVGKAPKGAALRVVVDIVAGTSAGGINGICLSKALALNEPQDALRDLWFNNGDIAKLVGGWKWVPTPVRAAVSIGRALFGAGANAPLKGDDMCRWLHEAFEAMDKSAPTGAAPKTLMPPGHMLELYITVTDLEGYARELPIEDPRIIKDRMHRHVLVFRHGGGGPNSFGTDYNHALAFAARATSSFPGAFPPLRFEDYRGYFDPNAKLENMVGDQFAIYGVNDVDPSKTSFVDGGVLDNAPFGHAVAAIRRRAAAVQVDRRLLYIEPDPISDNPAAPAKHKDDDVPGWLKTILSSVSSVPAGQPILDSLNDLAERNRLVKRIREVIETNFAPVKEQIETIVNARGLSLSTLSKTTDAATLTTLRDDVNKASKDQARFGWPSYVRLRLGIMLDDYAGLIARTLRYPATSYPGRFVESVVREWAKALLKNEPSNVETQAKFLRDTDFRYHERRLRFIIAAFSWWYGRLDEPGSPPRRKLDEAKEQIYAFVVAIDEAIRDLGEREKGRQALARAFPDAEVKAAARDQRTKEYVARHGADLDALRDLMQDAVAKYEAQHDRALYDAVAEICGAWPETMRTDLFARYLGFPFWDVIVHPMQALAAVDERDHVDVVRISPLDAKHLGDDGPKKLKGVGLHHFAAFFKREYRESDYLWGRLDAAERLVRLLLDDPLAPHLEEAPAKECRPFFEAIMAEEADALRTIPDVIGDIRRRIAGIPRV